jgi:lysylphosphatidylglycerol synthetase-like protein (DUF2156 family)
LVGAEKLMMLFSQVPAMILPGLTLVVSPLLSLMVDQLRKLPAFLPGGLLASSQVKAKCLQLLLVPSILVLTIV